MSVADSRSTAETNVIQRIVPLSGRHTSEAIEQSEIKEDVLGVSLQRFVQNVVTSPRFFHEQLIARALRRGARARQLARIGRGRPVFLSTAG